jgi:aryl-alcohol dehydrogenase-like predicted oxidoreductase
MDRSNGSGVPEAGFRRRRRTAATVFGNRRGQLALLALDQEMAFVPWSPLRNGFLSGKYRPGMEVTDSARTASVGGSNEEEFAVIEAVAAIADELGTTSAAVALAWLRARAKTVVPMP